MPKLPKQKEDFSAWYLDVVKQADLADYSKVKGCMVIKPYGYALWERIQAELDKRIKEADVSNVYFPLFIPESFLKKEKEHVKGFAPECAVVTHGGGKKLAEPLIVRPTSETIMYDTFSDWIQSYRDLPLKINQWANIVRWEMRTRPFLRTTEFLWQEGHTAHKTLEDADQEAERALKMYKDFDRDFLAIPVLTGKKSRKETFAGALYTLTTEALARDGKAIQAGTSHNLGQGFAKAFNIQFQDENGENQYVWQTSWGVSTRIIGTLAVVHGDDSGLKLPPNAAPIQVVFVPIYKDEQTKKKVLAYVADIKTSLDPEIRVKIDDREQVTPGFKFNEWELKGVPIRVEVGPKDMEKDEVVLMRRDTLEKESVKKDHAAKAIAQLLKDIQNNMLKQANDFITQHTYSCSSFDEFKKILEGGGGFIETDLCGEETCEEKIKEETKATVRVLLEKEKPRGKCLYCGKEGKIRAVLAKAY